MLARNRGGTQVVHDLIVYGKELGGEERARDGVVMKEAPLEAMSDAEMEKFNADNEAGRSHEGMTTPKL